MDLPLFSRLFIKSCLAKSKEIKGIDAGEKKDRRRDRSNTILEN
jgi:hypothetical protein